ncbi:Acyl-CoA dehydrogenase, short-chain specific [Candidatus Ornithobacterium hominis]|uniref:Cyclohex-1-ene-1-carbonyl-CoA dehydrogenase n=1 Tax=Candidatus Ornithobacterium hominis TaxID=2497989 RepID=A0A383TX29_9FLAO|nr:acyl-CoA dehydrogenase family protein [Candidatus Ornithobacterium hominis]MCT7904554.1 acyl-CoA dehydrogenase family protein [Candidatus Ornithobacterium hominis]SZD71451.1 Acyl-CoA dehydrogenase, short-chain specific [Candidatus Ornithobacterium hominis]SZD72132.1 Acyl-CoA dehydrogenase, short-chain specific [Candidatus Ornithobacterium hominis]
MRNPENEIIIQAAREFAQREIAPHVMDWDENQSFPVALFHQLGEMGFMGILVPEELGGAGLSYFDYVNIIDEISQVDPSIGLSIAAHNSLCTNHILCFGNQEQKEKWVPSLATGKVIGAWGLTEHNTGSDAGGMGTTAVRDGDEWVINGAKNFITHAISGDLAVVMTRTGEVGASRNSTVFVLEKGMPGFTSGKKENKLGMRASETAELIMNNVRVPDSHRLGEVGEGFKQALSILDGGRISIAALSLGISKGAYQAALKYSKERKQFGKSICEFQAINFKLAEMATKIKASELLIDEACRLKENDERMTMEGAMAKYYASEACVEISTDAVQIFGGYGYTKDFPVEKFYRDSKLCTIGEGTTEIQKLVIGREILKG